MAAPAKLEPRRSSGLLNPTGAKLTGSGSILSRKPMAAKRERLCVIVDCGYSHETQLKVLDLCSELGLVAMPDVQE